MDARRQVREQVVRAWHLLKAAAATIQAASDAVTAQRVALDGVRQEAQVGTRTTLDVLDAQNELVNAQVALANARRDRIVAGLPAGRCHWPHDGAGLASVCVGVSPGRPL
jgi:outer membrane protein